MFEWFRSVTGVDAPQIGQDTTVSFVAKNQGHRGPILYLESIRSHNDPVCVCVTPSCIFVFYLDATEVLPAATHVDEDLTHSLADTEQPALQHSEPTVVALSPLLGGSPSMITSVIGALYPLKKKQMMAQVGKRLSLPNDTFTCAFMLSTGGFIVGTQSGSVVRVWIDDSLRFEAVTMMHACTGSVASVAITESKAVAAGFDEGMISIWKPNEPVSDTIDLASTSEKKVACTAIVWVADDELWVGRSDGFISIIKGLTQTDELTYEGLSTISTLRYVPSIGTVIAVSDLAEMSLWSVTSKQFIQKYTANLLTCGSALSCVEIIGDDELILLGGSDGSFCVRSLKKKPMESLPTTVGQPNPDSPKSRESRYQCMLLHHWPQTDPVHASPVTAASYDYRTDTLLVGDVGCRVRTVERFYERLQDVRNY